MSVKCPLIGKADISYVEIVALLLKRNEIKGFCEHIGLLGFGADARDCNAVFIHYVANEVVVQINKFGPFSAVGLG